MPDAQIQFTSAEVGVVHEAMAGAAGDRNIWIVGGGDLAGQFADAGLLDEVTVQIAPVTLGGGAPLLRAGSSSLWRSWDETATLPAPGSRSFADP